MNMDRNIPPTAAGSATTPAGAPPTLPPMCSRCRRVIEPDFKYCPHCGQRQGQGQEWYYHPVFILVVALTVAGPLVLPLVWRSQRMRLVGKTIMTLVILVYTAYACYLCYQLFVWELSLSRELGDVMHQIHIR